jgi:hypothetical protein
MRTKCRLIATFHRPIHSHWSLPLKHNIQYVRHIFEILRICHLVTLLKSSQNFDVVPKTASKTLCTVYGFNLNIACCSSAFDENLCICFISSFYLLNKMNIVQRNVVEKLTCIFFKRKRMTLILISGLITSTLFMWTTVR